MSPERARRPVAELSGKQKDNRTALPCAVDEQVIVSHSIDALPPALSQASASVPTRSPLLADLEKISLSRRAMLQRSGTALLATGVGIPDISLADVDDWEVLLRELAALLDDKRVRDAQFDDAELQLMLPARVQNPAVVPARIRATSRQNRRLLLVGDNPLTLVADVQVLSPAQPDISLHVRAEGHRRLIALAESSDGWSVAYGTIVRETSACEVVRG